MRVKIEYGPGLETRKAAKFLEGLGVECAKVAYGPSYPVYGYADAATIDRLLKTPEVVSVSVVPEGLPDDLVVGGA